MKGKNIMPANLLLQAIILGLGTLVIPTCVNGCRLAFINKDYAIMSALIFGIIVGVGMLVVGVHDLIIVRSFGLTGIIIAVCVALYATYEAYNAILRANKNYIK